MEKIMKKVSVLVTLCMIMTTLSAQPIFAAGTYTVDNGGTITAVSAQRAAACDKMLKMSQMPWKLTATLRYCYGQDDNNQLTESSKVKVNCRWDNKLANEVIPRKGIPYSQVHREEEYSNGITLKKGTKTLASDPQYVSIYGTDCSSSVGFAWKAATGVYLARKDTGKIYRTKNMFADGIIASENENDYLILVGKYGKYYSARKNATTTKQVVTGLSAEGNYEEGEDIYSKVYAAIKPGDALLFRTTGGNGYGHVRLVAGVKIVYADAAKTKVDPEKSQVTCIEQAGFSKANGNCKTSWIPNDEIVPTGEFAGQTYTGVYTFNQLTGKSASPTINDGDKTRCYVPIRLKAFND